ncbi:MAG: hypothetical protein V4581_18810, partial [Bacteroidota bacterium]
NARTKTHPQPYQFSFYTHAYYDLNFNKFHYSGDTYQLKITKEFKNGVEVKNSKTVITNPTTGSRKIGQLEEQETQTTVKP